MDAKSCGLIGKAVCALLLHMEVTIASDAKFPEWAKIRQARAMSPWMKFRAGDHGTLEVLAKPRPTPRWRGKMTMRANFAVSVTAGGR